MTRKAAASSDRSDLDDISVRRALLLLVIEFAVFPWQAFKGSASVRRRSIQRTAVLAIALPIIALWGGHVLAAVLALAALGGILLSMILVHRGIERDRRAERQRRADRVRQMREELSAATGPAPR
jgi:hypothetical protein